MSDSMSIPENLRDIIGDADWFDASRVDLYLTCPRRYYYRHELHLLPNTGGNTDALIFGTAIHAALETHYHGTGWDMVPCLTVTRATWSVHSAVVDKLAASSLLFSTISPQTSRRNAAPKSQG